MIPRMGGTKIFRAAARGILFVSLTASIVLGARRDLEAQGADAKALIAKVVEEAGGEGALREKRDVEYTYLYRRAGTGAVDLSLERYVFDGEKSWARYRVHEGVHPSGPGPVVQGYDGQSTWQTVARMKSTDETSLTRADFLRKTNFYWFTMTFKLLDPGLRYSYAGKRKVGATTYEVVKVGFDQGIGDVSDTYVLYINPKTWRVDQFLFTVLDFGKKDPFMMEVEYERVDGVLLPTKRRYTPSDWSGNLPKDAEWTDEISIGIRFNNGFEPPLFQAP